MATQRITIRLAAGLLAAAEKKAAGLDKTLADYLRGLIEIDTGTEPEPLLQGTAALSKRQRKEQSRKALESKHGVARK